MSIQLFLDRDGTLIKDTGYISDPAKVVVLKGVIAGLNLFKSYGFGLHIVSNQSGVSRGMISKANFVAVDNRFKSIFLDNGIEFDSINYCLHQPLDNCSCRKPAPGLIAKIFQEYGIERSACGMIGNSEADADAAKNFGIAFWYVSEKKLNFFDIARKVVNHFDSN
jgi:D-glycero-D-manno-heptose 1,7-bisphosphate phosphatase